MARMGDEVPFIVPVGSVGYGPKYFGIHRATGSSAWWVDCPDGRRLTFSTYEAAYGYAQANLHVVAEVGNPDPYAVERLPLSEISGRATLPGGHIVTPSRSEKRKDPPRYTVTPAHLGWHVTVYGEMVWDTDMYWRPFRQWAEWKGSKELLKKMVPEWGRKKGVQVVWGEH